MLYQVSRGLILKQIWLVERAVSRQFGVVSSGELRETVSFLSRKRRVIEFPARVGINSFSVARVHNVGTRMTARGARIADTSLG